MSGVLEVKGLHVDIPTPAGMLYPVRDVGFDIESGETFCLVGESGCGKSLTALAIMDILPKKALRKADRLIFEGRDISEIRRREMSEIRGNKMSMIFQEPMTALNPCYTVGNQLEEALLCHKRVSRREARDRAVFLLDKVGITAAGSRLRQYPHQLSGGLRQRVMIAMALMCGPSLIIADEPTTALDVTIQAQILSLLVSLQQEFQMSLLLITHDLGVVARVAHRVAVMYCGEVVELGDVGELFANPLHPYTRGLMACIPVPGRTEPGCKLASIPGLVPSPIGHMEGCTYRNRCPDAIEDCAVGDIGLIEVSPGHYIRCRQNGAAVMEATDGLDD